MDTRASTVGLKEGYRRMVGREHPVNEQRDAKILEYKREDGKTEPVVVNQSIGYRFVKRLFDIIFSIIGIVALSPILLLTIIAIKLEDHGSAIFTQNRVGVGKKIFKMYKFRSMKINAAEIHEQMKKEYGCEDISFKLKEDPRVTRVGNFIRRTNIDEFPQLINILIGDMSFIGPRPLPDYEFAEEQKTFDGKYDDRYAVPQGLTCIWQISNRSEPSFSDRMQMDVDYAHKCGIKMDIKLFVQTFVYSIFGKASY